MAGFDKIIGNEQIKKHFCDAIQLNKVSHAYLLNGEDGLGKRMFADIFSQMLQCETPGEKPCGRCHSCKQCETKNHPDIIYVTHQKNIVGVDDVREQINKTIAIKPYNGSYKIYIIDEAEKMSAQAQNALLKTIEEPPDYAVILLLSANLESLLQTVRSRCVSLNLKPVSDEELKKYLDERGVEEEKIPALLKFAQGNIGKAWKMAESEDFSDMVDCMMDLLENVWDMDLSQLLGSIEKLSKYRLEIDDCLDFIRFWFRDVLMFKATNDMNILIFKDNYSSIHRIASKCSYEKLQQILDAIGLAKQRLDANVNFEQTMELMLFAFHL